MYIDGKIVILLQIKNPIFNLQLLYISVYRKFYFLQTPNTFLATFAAFT